MDHNASTPERRLHKHIEPVAQLGFAAYDHRRGCDDLTQMEWYFGGRLACLGAVPGEAAVALLAVLHPAGVVAGTTSTWAKTDPATLIACRLDAVERYLAPRAPSAFDAPTTSALLRRAIDALEPAGHPLFAGWRARGTAGAAVCDIWLSAVAIREHRGAAHIAAWRSCGLTPLEILVLTEASTGATLGSHAHTMMGWPLDAIRRAEAALSDAGWLADGTITTAGRAARAEIEDATDRQESPAVLALGSDLDVLCEQLALLADAAR